MQPVFAAALLMPDQDDARNGLDLRTHYYSVSRAFFFTIMLYLILDVGDTLLKGMEHFRSLGLEYSVGQGT